MARAAPNQRNLGGAGGAEYGIKAEEIQTFLGNDAKGGSINGPILDASVEKGKEALEMPEGVHPEWRMETEGKFQRTNWIKLPDSKTMRLCAPLTALGLKKGQKIRVSAVVPLCNTLFPFPGVREAEIILK